MYIHTCMCVYIYIYVCIYIYIYILLDCRHCGFYFAALTALAYRHCALIVIVIPLLLLVLPLLSTLLSLVEAAYHHCYCSPCYSPSSTGTTNTPGLHNKIPAHKIFARVWVAQESIFYTINAKIFQGLGPKRRESCNGDWVYCILRLFLSLWQLVCRM